MRQVTFPDEKEGGAEIDAETRLFIAEELSKLRDSLEERARQRDAHRRNWFLGVLAAITAALIGLAAFSFDTFKTRLVEATKEQLINGEFNLFKDQNAAAFGKFVLNQEQLLESYRSEIDERLSSLIGRVDRLPEQIRNQLSDEMLPTVEQDITEMRQLLTRFRNYVALRSALENLRERASQDEVDAIWRFFKALHVDAAARGFAAEQSDYPVIVQEVSSLLFGTGEFNRIRELVHLAQEEVARQPNVADDALSAFARRLLSEPRLSAWDMSLYEDTMRLAHSLRETGNVHYAAPLEMLILHTLKPEGWRADIQALLSVAHNLSGWDADNRKALAVARLIRYTSPDGLKAVPTEREALIAERARAFVESYSDDLSRLYCEIAKTEEFDGYIPRTDLDELRRLEEFELLLGDFQCGA